MALKIVYKICCGIDVHKTFVVACIASTNKQGVTTYKSHRFSTYTKCLKELLQWLLEFNCKDVCMESFPSAKLLCSWAGLTPTNNESAGKKKSVRVSKVGCYIKPLLVQCANSVVKSEKHPEIRNRYLRLRKRRGHKKAIIAIARMLLTHYTTC